MCGNVRYEAGGESAASVGECLSDILPVADGDVDSLPLHRLPQDWRQHLQHQWCL